ncbi:MAG: hypothetical protein LBP58_06915 [Azoarcus sp.]|jgi:hypothetical protein|nr:hypothetical protein [Azoarcus sp.]
MAELRDPKEIEIVCQDGSIRIYVISKLPAMAGMKLVTQYPIMASPKIGNYGELEKLMLELFGYIEAITPDGRRIRLGTRALIDNHVPDWEALARIQKAMAEYNVSFFQNGKLFDLLENFLQTAITKLTPMFAASLPSSSGNDSPASGN